MSKFMSLKQFAYYVDDKIHSSNLRTDRYITTDNLLQNKYGMTQALSLPAQEGNVTRFKKGDTLIANIRPYLKKIWLATFDGGCSADVLAIRPKRGIDCNFLFYALFRDDFFIHAMNGVKGTKMPRGDKNQIMDFIIPNLCISTQSKIVNALTALDQKIELNNHINAELEAMAKTLYDYWFVQFDFPDEKGRPYKSSGGKMVYNKVLKRKIPEGWSNSTLWDIAQYYNGLAMQKYRPQNDEFLPVIKIREMNEGFSSDTEKARPDIPQEAIIEDGDILFSWSASLEIKIWSQGRGALNQHIFKVTSKKYPKSFYYFELLNYLQHFKMIAELRKTTMGHITHDHLKQARICLPKLELLQSFNSIVNPLFEKYLLTEKENCSLMQLRDWLLPMLMNGQVNV